MINNQPLGAHDRGPAFQSTLVTGGKQRAHATLSRNAFAARPPKTKYIAAVRPHVVRIIHFARAPRLASAPTASRFSRTAGAAVFADTVATRHAGRVAAHARQRWPPLETFSAQAVRAT